MSSKKDLVEAHAFNRRRLVTAFVSGAPGGREVEPVRYGRTLVGGVVLAVFLVAGAAVLGLLKPTVEDDWDENTLVIGEDGSRFVALESGLFPVINTTSARLLLAQEDGTMTVRSVPDELIAEQTLQPTIGIAGAPDILPSPDNLLDSGWTACTNTTGDIKLRIASEPLAAALPDQALLVESKEDGSRYVITGSQRYPLPKGSRGEDVVRALGLSGATTYTVDGLWLDLIALGPVLESFAVSGQGDQLPTGLPGVDRVGTPLLVDGEKFLLVDDGGKPGLLNLTDFEYTMYLAYGVGKPPEQEVRTLDVSGLSNAEQIDGLDLPAEWPEEDVEEWQGPAPCMILEGAGSGVRSARLATPAPATASLLVPDQPGLSVEVEQGHGALVESTTAGVVKGENGSVVLIDSTGTRFAIGAPGDVSTVRTALGYGDVKPAPVPKPWTDLAAGDGPELTVAAAAERVTAP